MLSLTRPNLVLVCGWPRCRENQSVIAWMVHAVLYCFVALDIIPLGPGCIPPAAGMQGKLMFEFGRLLLADWKLACLMQGTQMLSLTRPNLVLVCGWPRCREYQCVIAWLVHAVLYCFVALDVERCGCLNILEIEMANWYPGPSKRQAEAVWFL